MLSKFWMWLKERCVKSGKAVLVVGGWVGLMSFLSHFFTVKVPMVMTSGGVTHTVMISKVVGISSLAYTGLWFLGGVLAAVVFVFWAVK